MFDNELVIQHALIVVQFGVFEPKHAERTSRFKNCASALYRFFTNSLHNSTIFVPTVVGRVDESPFREMAFLRIRPTALAVFEAPLIVKPSGPPAATLVASLGNTKRQRGTARRGTRG